MKFLLMAGLGPYMMDTQTLKGTLFSPNGSRDLAGSYKQIMGRPIDLTRLRYGNGDGYPLLRPFRGTMPNLTTETVRSILETTDIDFEILDLEDFWQGTGAPQKEHYDVIGLSTTFICDQFTIARTVNWIAEQFPRATLVLGGQYSNLKYVEIMRDHAAVDYIIRGDAERALPLLLRVLQGKADLRDVPNLVVRKSDGSVESRLYEYIDINAHPSPNFEGSHSVIPYESMRGCPFVCKYCSFPAASPLWRYKSVEKIVGDWRQYQEQNDVQVIRAMDSTFTIPPPRFRGLLQELPALNIIWEAFTRANTIDSRRVVEGLEEAGCRRLFVGIESMSNVTLKYMDKRVTAAQNLRACELLSESQIDLRGAFMVGYPGETPEEYELTHRFIIDQFRGRFGLHFFIFVDETMPVWQDADLHQIEVVNGGQWKHIGMDSKMAMELRNQTLFEARWQSDENVNAQWQLAYDRPLIKEMNLQQNIKVEKLIERLAFVAKDWGTGEVAASRGHAVLDELSALDIHHVDTPLGNGANNQDAEAELPLMLRDDRIYAS